MKDVGELLRLVSSSIMHNEIAHIFFSNKDIDLRACVTTRFNGCMQIVKRRCMCRVNRCMHACACVVNLVKKY